MLIENRACDECLRMCGYLVELGQSRPEYVYLCDDCLRRGREEIATALTDVADSAAVAKRKEKFRSDLQELNLQRVKCGLAPYFFGDRFMESGFFGT